MAADSDTNEIENTKLGLAFGGVGDVRPAEGVDKVERCHRASLGGSRPDSVPFATWVRSPRT